MKNRYIVGCQYKSSGFYSDENVIGLFTNKKEAIKKMKELSTRSGDYGENNTHIFKITKVKI